jgi:hypothetical protein
MKDTRFGENTNLERLQLLFTQLVLGMPGDREVVARFGQYVREKGEKWARAMLGAARDGYPTVLEDGEGREYTVNFRMAMAGDLTLHAAGPREALERFRSVEPRRLPIECGFDGSVTVDSIVDEDGAEYLAGEHDEIWHK